MSTDEQAAAKSPAKGDVVFFTIVEPGQTEVKHATYPAKVLRVYDDGSLCLKVETPHGDFIRDPAEQSSSLDAELNKWSYTDAVAAQPGAPAPAAESEAAETGEASAEQTAAGE